MSMCLPGMNCWQNTPLPSCPTCDSCITVFPSSCTSECIFLLYFNFFLIYKGTNLINSGIESDDDLTTVIEKLDELISSGGVPLSRTLTIDGISYDLSADRTWTTSGGITNSALLNELMKSDGTNAISSGLTSTNTGVITLSPTTPGTSLTISTSGIGILSLTGTLMYSKVIIQHFNGRQVPIVKQIQPR